MASKSGQFFVTGLAAAVGFFVIWPLEVVKNLEQAETKGMGTGMLARAQYVYKTQGIQGFWRGYLPGCQSVFMRNGSGMIVLQLAQKKLTAVGFRD